jgi:G:T/U-mismatch repair DNA glycosylase
MIHTVHRYLDANLIKPDDRAIILGTIHPHRAERFQIDYFYGNRNSFWQIMAAAFPHLHWDSLSAIRQNLADYHIWISDMIRECDRADESISSDSQLQNLILNTEQIEKGLKSVPIETIFFTSGFGKNSAARLFCEAFHISARPNAFNRDFLIPQKYFGREIHGILLISPSGIANRGLHRNPLFLKEKDKYINLPHPYQQFKVDFYRERFASVFEFCNI